MKKYILGVETTAHTFGVAVVSDEKNPQILANEKDSFTTEDGEGGMIPMEVKKHHDDVADVVYNKALEVAGISEEDIEAIALSNAPGLAPCLLAGMEFAKSLSKKLKIPIVKVNHCIAHLEIGELIDGEKPDNPVLLYASGANTQVIAYEAGKYRVFGETLDMGVGNFIDTFARYAGIGFPGGPKIMKLAEKSDNYIELPYSIKGMDVSFSGILTKLRNLIENNKYSIEDLSYSMQETVFAMLVEASERAIAHTGKKELLLGGGVACNTRLQEMCRIMCKERGCKLFVPKNSLLVDNAAMIAYLGLKMFKKNIFVKWGEVDNRDILDIEPRERTDDVEVLWK